MATTFTIRLDEIEETEQQLRDFLSAHDKFFTRYVIAKEVAEQTKKRHYQGWIEVTCARSTWQNWIKVFPHKKHQKSFAEMRSETYRSYAVKDGDIKFDKGVTDDEIAAWKAASYRKGDESTSGREKRKGVFEQIREYIIEYKQKHATTEFDGWSIAKLIIKWYLDHNKCEPNDFQIRSMSKSIWCYIKSQGDSGLFDKYLEDRARQIIGSEWIH